MEQLLSTVPGAQDVTKMQDRKQGTVALSDHLLERGTENGSLRGHLGVEKQQGVKKARRQVREEVGARRGWPGASCSPH